MHKSASPGLLAWLAAIAVHAGIVWLLGATVLADAKHPTTRRDLSSWAGGTQTPTAAGSGSAL